MIKSMTGFGRAEVHKNDRKVTVEVRSVNHKYFDLGIKMPRKLNVFETKLRSLMKQYASRGKIDVFVFYEDNSEGAACLKYNPELAAEYYEYYMRICEEFDVDDDIRTSTIARAQDVITIEEQEVNEEEVWEIVEAAATEAFTVFSDSRGKEGEALKNDILEKLNAMRSHVAFIEEKLPELISAYKKKIEERVKEFLETASIDENRIAAEVTIYADKVAIDEEVVRLSTHINNMQDILENSGQAGRNLDFLAQEMNREANTILSKANDIDITNTGIELKTCIEKIREQIQNIE